MARLFLVLAVLVLLPMVAAVDSYKPYLHNPVVPDHPAVKLFGQYNTLLFPGAATYTYPISVPPGTHGLQPDINLYYNSQSATQRPGTLGAGWSLNQNYIYRDVNSTPDDTSDDQYVLVFQNNVYQLIYSTQDLQWHTEVDYHFRIRNLTNTQNTDGESWELTTTDGTTYRFGHNGDSERPSNTGRSYALKWYEDQQNDTFGNTITYAYTQDPNPEDTGTDYLSTISYDNDQQRNVTFTYESTARPDDRLVYEQGNTVRESRRLTDITVTADGTLVRRYHLNYTMLSPSTSSLASITRYGNDNTSILHTIRFGYNNATTGYTQSTAWQPPVAFDNTNGSDQGVRLIDINNDGYADLIKGRQATGEHLAWINNKTGGWTSNTTWAPPVYFVYANGSDDGARFADVNNDGLIDIIVSVTGASQVYLNNGTGWSNTSSTVWVAPLPFIDGSSVDQGTQIADLDGDGRVDLLRAKNGVPNAVYLNNGSGWTNKTNTWSIPVTFSNGTDTGARLIDINGDGLPDIIQANGTGNSVWLNNGAGWTRDLNWTVPVDFTNKTFVDTGVRLVDVDGDGLPDLVQNLATSTIVVNNTWINNGTGWTLNNTWTTPESMVKNSSNTGRRLADITGDNAADILTSTNGTVQHAWIKNPGTSYVLASITNEYGGTTSINYTTSTQYNNTDANGAGTIGFNIPVVQRITKNNSLSAPFGIASTTNYSYNGGVYNYTKREFRGFAITTEQTPSAIVQHYFFQDSPRRGKEYETDTSDLSGTLFLRTTTDYNSTYAFGIYNITVTSRTTYAYDGASTPRVTNTTYLYDWFGNPLSIVEQGDVNVTGDERTTNITYAYGKTAWILNHPATETVYDSDGNKVKQSLFYYDNIGLAGIGTAGALTRQEEWNNNTNNTVTTYDYDSHGNPTRITDSNGASTQLAYDGTSTYPTTSINPLGHITYASYDLATGNLLNEKKNDITTTYTYDAQGRPSTEAQPGDTSGMPTKRYQYNDTPPVNVHVSLRTTANNTQDATYYYDGFADLVQVQSSTDTGSVIKNIYYDSSGRASAEDNPYLAASTNGLSAPASGTPQTNYTYDPLDRVTFVRNTDGTNKTTGFDRANITDVDENGNAHVYVIDTLGRITTVREENADPRSNRTEWYNTTYQYDANDNLITITDTLGHVTRFSYDSQGQKIAMMDPDLGNWSYQYDNRGNLITQTDARGQRTTLSYDALNRITNKSSADVNETYQYDGQYQGTLTSLTMNNVTCQYNYDERLRLTSKTDTLDSTPFTLGYVYDSQDRIISEQGLGNHVDYVYDKQGLVRSIPGYITTSTHDAFGSLTNRTSANGLITSMAYNATNHRLIGITIPNVQNLTYSYDNGGNIKTINDRGTLTSLTYDGLDRLIQATIGQDRYEYTYNPTGNIMDSVKNNASKKYIYNNLAHAPSTVIDNAAGADVYHETSLDTQNKNRTIEYFLINDQNTTATGLNTTVSFGDGSTFSANNLSMNASVLFLVQQAYANGGTYHVNITAAAPNSTDYETDPLTFGLHATSLRVTSANLSNRTFAFSITSDLTAPLGSVVWTCTGGITGTIPSLTGTIIANLSANYTSTGPKTLNCNATSSDGNDALTITFTIPGLDLAPIDTLYTNVSRRVISTIATNNYYALKPTLNVTYEAGSFAANVNLSANQQVFVFAEVNNTVGKTKAIRVSIADANNTANQTSTYDVAGVSIDEYHRIDTSNTSKVYLYTLRNKWDTSTLSWTFTDPNITNSSVLLNNQTLFVMIAGNYTQGDQTPTINASILTDTESIADHFTCKPLSLTSLQTIGQASNGAVSELDINNYAGSAQNVTWQYNTGAQNITNTTSITNSLIIIIRSNATPNNVYQTIATINSSTNNDNRTGVIIQ